MSMANTARCRLENVPYVNKGTYELLVINENGEVL